MMENFMITLAFCLCTATLCAQQKANALSSQGIFYSQGTGCNYDGKADDLSRKRAPELMAWIRNSPKWKVEGEAYSAEFYDSAAWKKNKDDSAKSLLL